MNLLLAQMKVVVQMNQGKKSLSHLNTVIRPPSYHLLFPRVIGITLGDIMINRVLFEIYAGPQHLNDDLT